MPEDGSSGLAGLGGGERGVIMSCMAVVVWLNTFAFLQRRCRAGRVFADQADIACTKREAP